MPKVKLTKTQKKIIQALDKDKKAKQPAPDEAYEYPNEYVAYYGGAVIAHGSDFDKVKEEAYRQAPFPAFVKNLPAGVNII